MKILSLNHYWRIIAAGISYIVFTVGAFFPVIHAVLIVVFVKDQEGKQKKIRKTIQRLCKFYVDFMQFLGLMSYDLERLNSDEIKGKVVISNHSMLIDALFILAYVDDVCCVVKEALFRNPVTRLTVSLAGYIPNDEEDLVGMAAEKLAAGENILIFPEGTRNQYDTQLEFKRGAANIAIHANSDIVPFLITCSPRALQKYESWYQLPDIKSKILVRINPTLTIEECIDTSLARTIQYRRLTGFLRDYYLTAIMQLDNYTTKTDKPPPHFE
ncbi:lysophospholipid acyltransferase family protein [Cocleimonas sp. KMM 6892]|uniref:lysophospholipid acyltransferase family protein n=1 Tax=unclassified Cocleimonas TaxID=2639732 RepID=UPI002DBB40BB|nr:MULTISPECIES: lysophospholipid acyltransferase family protein [unclassified Cocleimonas]MEB8432452.1 lysophospholipid acyltransferase family protein [Cocleimonas sp. KMM 6892]MEC4715311.1 lysophospholipid acyltransferase family protein [Cocleimonas sp. KMM 6895]MEC4745070.1 lysophospholipid acyltransferase family protein [Cocleimonas sp. KMM 6896]